MDSDDRVLREEMLRREVLAGNEKAWRIWYGETFDGLYQYVLWRCGGRRDWADEIVQETWLLAVRRVRLFHQHTTDNRDFIVISLSRLTPAARHFGRYSSGTS